MVTVTAKKLDTDKLPRVAVMTAVFFVASLIHVPVGPTSVHLILSGLIGIILGPLAISAILVGLILQALLFQHGGLTTLGVNTLVMALPALAAWGLFRLLRPVRGITTLVTGMIAGGMATVLGALLLALALVSTGDAFRPLAGYVLLAHIPVVVLEVLITGFTVSFLCRVKPEVLANAGIRQASKTPASTAAPADAAPQKARRYRADSGS